MVLGSKGIYIYIYIYIFQLNFFGIFFVKRPNKLHTYLRSRYVQPTEPTPKNNNSIRVFNLHPVLRKIMKTMVENKFLYWGCSLIPPLIGNPYSILYIDPYYWVDDHPYLFSNNGSLDPIAHIYVKLSALGTVRSEPFEENSLTARPTCKMGHHYSCTVNGVI